MTYNQGLRLRKKDIVRNKKTGEIGLVKSVCVESKYCLQIITAFGDNTKAVDCKTLDLLNVEYSQHNSKPATCPICAKRSLNYDLGSTTFADQYGTEAPWKCSSCGAEGKEQYIQTLLGKDFAGHIIVNFGGKELGLRGLASQINVELVS